MTDGPATRRHFLRLGVGLTATTLAGCTTQSDDTPAFLDDTPTNPSTTTARTPNRPPPAHGPVGFPSPYGAPEPHRYSDLPDFTNWAASTTPVEFNPYRLDTDTFDITITLDTITLDIDRIHVARPTIVTAHYPRANGSTTTTTQRLEPTTDTDTDAETPADCTGSCDFTARTLTFDVSDTAFPRHTECRIEFTVHDADWADRYPPRSLTRQRVVVFDYDTPEGTATAITDDIEPYASSPENHPRKLAIDHVDTEDAREVFFVMYGDGRLYPAQATVPHALEDEYQANRTNNDYRLAHHTATYMYNSADLPHLRGLADSLGATLDHHDITDTFDRLQQLAYFIGNIPYHRNDPKDPQHTVLYTQQGDCSEMTMLYLALMNTPAFDNTRGCYITCSLRDVRHAVIGIDERDIDPPNPNDIHWVQPSAAALDDCFPDTRYAFLEATAPRRVGAFDENDYEIHYVNDTNTLHCSPELRTFGTDSSDL